MKRAFKRTERRRLADNIIEQIISGIKSRRLRLGEKLPSELMLMKEFGVGRNTLREAIGALTIIGVLDVRPGYGTRIIASPEEFMEKSSNSENYVKGDKVKDLIEARIFLEEILAGLAAKNATKEDRNKLKRILDALNQLRNSRRKVLKLDLEFHFALAEAAHNNVLFGFFEQLHNFVHIWIEQVTAEKVEKDDINRLIGQHKKIFRSIETKNEEQAKRVLREHLEIASNNLKIDLLQRKVRFNNWDSIDKILSCKSEGILSSKS